MDRTVVGIDRRTLLGGGATAAVVAPSLVKAQSSGAPTPGPASYTPTPLVAPEAVIPLWPGDPPGAGARGRATVTPGPYPGSIRGIDRPTLGLYRPAAPDGSAVIVCPGGGYRQLSIAHEGSAPALRLNEAGVTVFVLSYRLPGEGWPAPASVPLQDLQRAVRLLRRRAREFGIDPARLGVMGFSAGGHLAATLATCHGERAYAPVDVADAESARPAFVGLVYPVITMRAPHAFAPGVPLLLGANPSDSLIASRSNELLVTPSTPPCFLSHGFDDALVPVENSLMMIAALRAQKVQCEAHLFEVGHHGFGIGIPGETNEKWLDYFLGWMRQAPRAGRE